MVGVGVVCFSRSRVLIVKRVIDELRRAGFRSASVGLMMVSRGAIPS